MQPCSRELIRRLTASPSSGPGWRPRFPSFPTCSGQVDITPLPSSVPLHSIRETDQLPASIADSPCTTPAFNRRRRHQANIAPSIGRRAQVVARATAWLPQHPNGPFFLWVHLNDPGAASATSYNLSVAAADAAVGKLIAVLRARKLYDDALIVIASDHGESLGAHGEETHGVFLYDETIHVPLLLKSPQNQNAGKRVRGPGPPGGCCPHHSRNRGSANSVADAGAVFAPNREGQCRSAGLLGQQFSAAGIRMERAWNPGVPENISTSRRHGPSSMISRLTPAPRATWRKLPKPRWKLSPANWMRSTGVSTIRAALPGRPSLLRAKCKSWHRWVMSACRNHPFPQARQQPESIQKMRLQPQIKYLSALALLNDGKPERAVAILQPVRADTRMYLAQFVMGAALARQQQYPQAIEYLHRAIELQPDSTWAHYEMGSSLLKTGDYKTAVVHLEIASSRLPDFAEAHFPSGAGLRASGPGRGREARTLKVDCSSGNEALISTIHAKPSAPRRSRNNSIMSIVLVDLYRDVDVYYFPMVTRHISKTCTCTCCRCTCCSRRGHGDGM